jgi:hypothetical protein
MSAAFAARDATKAVVVYRRLEPLGTRSDSIARRLGAAVCAES